MIKKIQEPNNVAQGDSGNDHTVFYVQSHLNFSNGEAIFTEITETFQREIRFSQIFTLYFKSTIASYRIT